MSNERVAFKAKFRKTTDVREILERNSFTNAITEQMWWAFQAGAEWQRSHSAPAGYVMVPVELIDSFPEINPNNYSHDEVCDLNAWGCDLVLAAIAAAPKAEQPPVQEPVWNRKAGVLGCKEVMSDKCYQAQSAAMQANYEPQPVSDDAKDAARRRFYREGFTDPAKHDAIVDALVGGKGDE